MLSPIMTVVVLAVLWLIVVVPMILRRNDDRARERSVDGIRTRDARADRRQGAPQPRGRVPVARTPRSSLLRGSRAAGRDCSSPERAESSSHLLCADPFPPPRRR